MRQLILALHGNPGDIDDFQLIFEKLGVDNNLKIILQPRPKGGVELDKLITDIQKTVVKYHDREITLIAYSWGCFLACLTSLTVKSSVSRMILISPIIVTDNPLNSFVANIPRLPVIGNLLLKKVAGKQSHKFIERTFHPHKLSNHLYSSLFDKLDDPIIWNGAICYKYQQQNLDISTYGNIENIEIVVIRGEKDITTSWPLQEKALRRLSPCWENVKVHVIQSAGHALPWTQPDRIVQLIQDTLNHRNNCRPSITENKTKSTANNVVTLLKEHAQHSPDKIALRWVNSRIAQEFSGDQLKRFDTSEINYSDFYEMICRLAKGLTELGLGAGDRIILFLPMSLEMYVAMFAIQHIGAAAVFLDSWARRNHLGACAKCVSPKAMISHAKAFELIAGISELDSIEIRIVAGNASDEGYSARIETLLSATGHLPITQVNLDDTALITFTTGSSGDPKGANRTHRFLYAQHAALKQVVPYIDGDLDIPAFPIFSLNNLASGVTTVLPAIDLAQPHPNDAAVLVSQIMRENVSCTTLSPSMFNGVSAFCLRSQVSLSSVRRVITGGAPVSRDSVRDFIKIAPNAEIWILYGSTEVEPMAHIEAKQMLSMHVSRDEEIVEEGVNVGCIANGLRYKFIRPFKGAIEFDSFDWKNWELPQYEIGEFVVSGDHVCANYYNNENAFLKTKIRDINGTVWHRTGDLARLDQSGNLWIVGRVHNMVRRQDKNYFPVKVEVILNRCEFIQNSAFLGLPDAVLGERAAVVVQFSSGFEDKQTGVSEILRLLKKNEIIIDCLYEADDIPMDPRHHSKVEYTIVRDNILQEKYHAVLGSK